jgi:hypothetical protein
LAGLGLIALFRTIGERFVCSGGQLGRDKKLDHWRRKMPIKLILKLVVALVLAVLIAPTSDQRPFEEVAKRAAAAEETSKPGTKCPLSREQVDKTDLSLLSICLSYGLGAYDAAQRYPNIATNVFSVYGDDEKFQEILSQYGHQVIPVIAYFVENGPVDTRVRFALGEGLKKIWTGEAPALSLNEATPEQLGLIAIYEIASRGHEMLAEFEIVDGVARRKPITAFVLGTKYFLAGGISDVEKVMVRGERWPTWKEAGSALLDSAIIFGGAGAVTKVARADELAEKSGARLFVESAYKTIRTVGTTSLYMAPVALIYLAITKPQLIPALGGWIVEQLGFNRYVGIVAVCFIGVFAVIELFWPLIWCITIFGRWVRRFLPLLTPWARSPRFERASGLHP